jgi:hypothetical protein
MKTVKVPIIAKVFFHHVWDCSMYVMHSVSTKNNIKTEKWTD